MPALARGAGGVELAGQVWCQNIADGLQQRQQRQQQRQRPLGAGKPETRNRHLDLPTSVRNLLINQYGDGGGAISCAEAMLAFQTIGAMLGAVPSALAANVAKRGGNNGERSGQGSYATLALLERRARMSAALAAGATDVPSLSPPPTESDLARGPLISPFVVLATLYRALDAVTMLLRLDANSAQCILKTNNRLARVNVTAGRVKSRQAHVEQNDGSSSSSSSSSSDDDGEGDEDDDGFW